MRIRFAIGIGTMSMGIIEAEVVALHSIPELKCAVEYLSRFDQYRAPRESFEELRLREVPPYAPIGCSVKYTSRGCIFLRNLRLVRDLREDTRPDFPGINSLCGADIASIKLSVFPEFLPNTLGGKAGVELFYGAFSYPTGSWDVDVSSIDIVCSDNLRRLFGSAKYKLKS